LRAIRFHYRPARYLLTRLTGARRVFEMGSGFGYSTAWFARGVQENGGGTVHHVVWDEDLSRRARYGAAHGVFGTIYDVGDALRPITAGLLVASVGYARMFQVMASVAFLVMLAFVLLSGTPQHEVVSADGPAR
jgi:hypothetical protein